MTVDLLISAFACLGVAIATDLLLGPRSRWARPAPYILVALANCCLLISGARVMAAPSARNLSLGHLFGAGHTFLVLDGLSAMFLVITSAVALFISMCFVSWSRLAASTSRRGLGAGYALLVASVPAVILAGDAFSFLFAWELLSVSFYVLIVHKRTSEDHVERGWLALSTAKVSGASLLLGFLILSARSGSFAIASWHAVAPGPARDIAWLLIVVGFAAKIGIAPFSVWMPASYPSAPGPARAALAAVGMNVGIYGLWRFLGVLGHPPLWLAAGVLLTGGATALGGIAFAAVQTDLLRTIAYSSVENAGIIFTAYGVALTGAASGNEPLVALGLLAATLQAVSHALAKAGIFIAAGNAEVAGHTTRLDGISGLAKRLPVSAVTFAASALTLAGLPPSIGFVSEWFVLEALMQQFRVHDLAMRLALAGAGAMVALTAGLAALTFARLAGFSVLGGSGGVGTIWFKGREGVEGAPLRREQNGRHERARTQEGLFGKLGAAALAASCMAAAAMAPLVVRFIARGLASVVNAGLVRGALRSPMVLQPVFANFSILSPTWLWIVLGSFLAATFLLTVLVSRGSFLRVRRVPPWMSASTEPTRTASYTSFAYVNPLRHVLANLLQSRTEVRRIPASAALVPAGAPTGTQAAAPDKGYAPPEHARTEYARTVSDPIATWLYHPLRAAWLQAARHAQRLQSGKLAWYMAYMLVALIVLMAVVAGSR